MPKSFRSSIQCDSGTVALKMIQAVVLAGQTEIRRFVIEAEAAAKFDHPEMVPVYKSGWVNPPGDREIRTPRPFRAFPQDRTSVR